MSKPIENTPVISGSDADKLLALLHCVASPEEIERRKNISESRLSDSKVAPFIDRTGRLRLGNGIWYRPGSAWE